ncbi:GntR family transcriptional regulator [Pseudochelatococcus sp. B33]
MDSGKLKIHDPAVSLYEQVRRDLLARISSGEFKPGDLLPTEEALCREYDVSRITVRRAVADLAANFVVTRRRGVGTIVTRRVSDRRVFRLTGFFDDASPFDATELVNVVKPASEEIASALHIEPGMLVRHRRLVTKRNDDPFTVTDGFTVEDPGNGGDSGVQQSQGYRFGPRAARAEQELAATKASAMVARHLGITPGRPVMFARRVYLSGDDKPVRYSITTYHPDRYRFTVDLRPDHNQLTFEASVDPSQQHKQGRKV